MSAASKTVLVVDDDPEIRKLLVASFSRLGFTVTQAADGKNAIKQLEAARPSLLCIDLMLPEQSGYDVCEHVNRTPSLQALPIMMVSARTLPADRAEAEELGVKVYLTKPFTQDQLKAAIIEAMEGA